MSRTFGQLIWTIATVLVLGVPGLSHGSETTSARWFGELSIEDRVFIQANLILLGHYSALVDAEFGPSTYKAILNYQRSRGTNTTGVLSKSQIEGLKADAAEVFSTLGMEIVKDKRANLSIILPLAILGPPEQTTRGHSYQSKDGSIEVETIRKPFADEPFDDFFVSLSTDTGRRRITYTSFRPDRFVVSGTLAAKSFYMMFLNAGDASVGYSMTWTKAEQKLGAMVATFAASMIDPVDAAGETTPDKAPDPKPGPSTPPKPTLASGSGFFFAPKGMIITNQHVVEGCQSISIPGFGAATVLKSDAGVDLAVLQLNSDRKHIWASIRRTPPVLGEDVILLGYPLSDLLNSSLNIGTGIVSAERAVGRHPEWFTTNAGIQPGSSGGPVLDRKGNVVGVAVAKTDDVALLAEAGTVAANVGFAISSPNVLDFIEVFRHTADGGENPAEADSVRDVVARTRDFTVQVICKLN